MTDPLPRLRIADTVALLLVTLSGGYLRLHHLGWPSLWLDEILNVDITRRLGALPWWRWLVGFEPENGPLYFALHALAIDLPGPIELRWRIPAAILGVATIPIAFFATRLVSRSTPAAHCAAFLFAVSPFHVFYSREGRTYALLLLETIVIIMGLAMPKGRRGLVTLTVAVVAAAYTAATAAPLIASVLLLGIVRFVRDRDREGLKLVAIGAAGVALVALLYLSQDRTPSQAAFSSDAARIARDTLVMFSSTTQPARSLPRISAFLALFAILGAAAMAKRDRRSLDVVVVFPLSILTMTLAALAFTDHWFSVRYLTPLFALFLLNAATGLWFAALFITRRVRGTTGRNVAATLATALGLFAIGEDQAILALREPYERPDWRGAATIIAKHARPDDVVMAANSWSWVSLDFYLREVGAPVKIEHAFENVGTVAEQRDHRRAQWFAGGGVYDNETIRFWMCERLDLVYADESDQLRIYYGAGELDLLEERLTDDEFARYRGRRENNTIEPGRDSTRLGAGWYLPEKEGSSVFRWASSPAVIRLPAAASPRVLKFRAMGVNGAQQVWLERNGLKLGAPLVMKEGWNDYAIPLPAGGERIEELAFAFATTTSPSAVGVDDRRVLAAAFESICAVPDEKAACRPAQASFPVRLDTGVPRRPRLPFWRAAEGKPDLQAIEGLLVRLGMDPRIAGSIASRQDDLQRIVRLGMLSHECGDELEFAQLAYSKILERGTDSGTTEDARAILRRSGRTSFLDELMRTREFRRKYYETEGERSEALVQR